MRILITTNHPAPYIDKWLDVLSINHKVDALYVNKKSSEKSWKNYEVKNAYYYNDFRFSEIISFFKKYDLIIFGGWFHKINIFYCQLLKLTSTKTAFFADHPEIKTLNKFDIYVKKMIIQSADYLFAASFSTKEFFINSYGIRNEKIKIFPYAHNFDFKVEKNIIGNKIKIFIANRFIERKGYKIVLESFKILKEKRMLNNFEILIVGGGPEYLYYKNEFQKLSDSIEVKEWIENDEYIMNLKNTNIFLHASLFEPFGIPPLDALQLGKIVVVSDGVKSMSHLKGSSDGIIVYSSADYVELSNILLKFAQNQQNIDFSDHNYSVVKNNYNLQLLTQAVATV